ncbi:hypothetical protein [uncultured Parvimonas sp.]|uniref:hypothetical protein n=1 Tax=uncultured Parvimonas sp. TaxID=747372 RepID=UPI002596F115|nr:hypothetical protein [uncultured Parvimonas sp.]
MNNIIDLNEILSRRAKVKLKNKVLSVKDITILQFEKMLEIEKSNNINEQCKLLAEILSNNDEKINVSVNELKAMTRPAIIHLWNVFALRSIDIVSDPN